MRFGWCAGLMLGMVTVWTSPAMAGSNEDARAIEAEALRSMRAGETEAAYLLALEADALSSSVVSRWLVAIGADGLGKRGQALAAYRGLLAEGSLPAVRAAEAERRVAALAKVPAEEEPPDEEPDPPEPEPPEGDEPDPPPPAPEPPDPPVLPEPAPAPGPLGAAEDTGPGPTAIGLRVGGFLCLAGTFAAGGALVYYGLSSRTAVSSNARYVNGVYAQRLIPVTAGLGAAALVMLPLGYLVAWDDADAADAKATKETHVSLAPGPGELGMGVNVRF